MQILNYISESRILVLRDDEGFGYEWNNVTNLIVCGSQQEILAYSSSTILASFPIQSTNINYVTTSLAYAPATSDTRGTATADTASSLQWYFTIQTYDPKIVDQVNYYITSSILSTNSSGSDSRGANPLIPHQQCTIVATGSGTYNSSIYLYNVSQAPLLPGLPGVLILTASAVDQGVSMSFYPSESVNYRAYIDIIGSYAP